MKDGYLFCIPNDTWSVILTGVSTLIIFIGVPVALANLRVITRTHRLESLTKFLDELASSEQDRLYLFKEFERKEDYAELDRDSEEKIKNVVNTLNRIAMLVENNVVSPASVFGLCHTLIIRCTYKLELYMKYKENKMGTRYGRRIFRLSERAKKFHDALPHQRINEIKIYDKTSSTVIYKTTKYNGMKGLCQLIRWKYLKFFNKY